LVTVQADAFRPAKRPGVMRAIKGNIGAAAAKKWNGDEKIAIKQKAGRKTCRFPSNAGGQAVLFAAEARTKRRC
jgi:hypothetical protein